MIMSNNFDEAQRLINQSSPSKRMAYIQQQQLGPQALVTPQKSLAQQNQQINFATIGKAIQ